MEQEGNAIQFGNRKPPRPVRTPPSLSLSLYSRFLHSVSEILGLGWTVWTAETSTGACLKWSGSKPVSPECPFLAHKTGSGKMRPERDCRLYWFISNEVSSAVARFTPEWPRCDFEASSHQFPQLGFSFIFFLPHGDQEVQKPSERSWSDCSDVVCWRSKIQRHTCPSLP